MLTREQLKTKDYEIVGVAPPNVEPPPEWVVRLELQGHWFFAIRGPGWDQRYQYAASKESCGPNLIKSLQAAYDAGFIAGMNRGL